jgi:hypothetical protein
LPSDNTYTHSYANTNCYADSCTYSDRLVSGCKTLRSQWNVAVAAIKNHLFNAARVVKEIRHVYEVRPRKDRRGVDLISGALPFGRLWYAGEIAIPNAIGYSKFYSRSHHAVICVYDDADNVIETHEHRRDFQRVMRLFI